MSELVPTKLFINIPNYISIQRPFLYKMMLIFVVITILGAANVILAYKFTKNLDVYSHPHHTNDITCYSKTTGDALLSLDEAMLATSDNIFFVETSCKGYLDSRQACSIESAARAHPNRLINLLFAGTVSNSTLNTGVLQKLQTFDNVNIARVKLGKAVKGTPLELIISKGLLNQSIHRVSHASDILRYLMLWRHGGVYMDLDMVTLKSFDTLYRDFAGAETDHWIAAGVIGLSKSYVGRRLAATLVRELGNNFDPNQWGVNGPQLLTKALRDLCKTSNVEMMSAEQCQGFKIYNKEVFYPIDAAHWRKYLEPTNIDLTQAYGVHYWNKNSHFNRIPKNSLFARLAKKYCPTVFNMLKDDFGST